MQHTLPHNLQVKRWVRCFIAMTQDQAKRMYQAEQQGLAPAVNVVKAASAKKAEEKSTAATASISARAARAAARAKKAEEESTAAPTAKRRRSRIPPLNSRPITENEDHAGTNKKFELGLYLDPFNDEEYGVWDAWRQAPKSKRGQCMFFAIADQLERLPPGQRGVRTAQELRKLAVSHQRSKLTSKDFDPDIHRSKKDLRNMAKAGTYAEDNELLALRKELMVNVRMLISCNGVQRWSWHWNERNLEWPTIRLGFRFVSDNSAHNHYYSMREFSKTIDFVVTPVENSRIFSL